LNQFITDKAGLIESALRGVVRASNETLALLEGYPEIKVVVRRNLDPSKVSIISGGGSGHEPAHAGYVGRGMLHAAVCGEVFASPSVDAVLAAIAAVTGEAGALLIVKNYTGDRLNFGLAAEKARALGLKVETVIVSDDIALADSSQPRGLAGTLFVHKVAGHLSEKGASLAEVTEVARRAASQIATLGLAVDTCTVPGAKKVDRIGADQVELGLGIHGEPGVELIPNVSLALLVDRVAEILASHRKSHQPLALLLNNLGGMTELEMASISEALAVTPLYGRSQLLIGPGSFMTSLDMKGFSISSIVLDSEIEEAVLSTVSPIAWHTPSRTGKIQYQPQTLSLEPSSYARSHNPFNRRIVQTSLQLLLDSEAHLNELDAMVGDGDTGTTFASAAKSLLAQMDNLPFDSVQALLASIADTLGRSMGGSSGILLAIFFQAASDQLRGHQTGLADALKAGLEKMKSYGGAKLGDRTMIDALEPALEELLRGQSLSAASLSARVGADATKSMRAARAGRSAHVAARSLDGNIDPGAEAVALLMEKLASVIG
jgi:dihydroxyacetone kinase